MDWQADASLQNQNLYTDLRRVAKRIRKSQKAVNFTHVYRWLMHFYNSRLLYLQSTCVDLRWVAKW